MFDYWTFTEELYLSKENFFQAKQMRRATKQAASKEIKKDVARA